MSTAATIPPTWIEFAKPADLAGFLLTCLSEPVCGPGTEVDRQLNHLYYALQTRLIYVQFQASADITKLVISIAIANSGKPLPRSPRIGNSRQLTRLQFVRAVPLQQDQDPRCPDVLIVAFHQAQLEQLSNFFDTIGQIGVRSIEFAFVAGSAGEFSHLVRLRGLTDLKAILAASASAGCQITLFGPVRSERAVPKFFVKLGHRYPIQGLERLAQIDSELVLLRPGAQNPQLTEWVQLAHGQLNFFRRLSESVDLKLSDEMAEIISLQEDPDPRPVPIELALTPRPQGPPSQLVEIDRQIDRYQRLMSDLNQARERLTTSDTDEVYFAYCFDQPAGESLNPGLTGFLQQRVATLRNCQYAFCQPSADDLPPFHLIVARRSQKHEGFSLQSADRVYFQPAAWRQSEVPLYLPWGMELAPRIDSHDAVELLHRFLEESASAGGQSLPPHVPPAAECQVILWDRGRRGEVIETRVPALSGLLDQFRVLNAFRRETAAEVTQATVAQLEQGLTRSRARSDEELNRLTKELYEHVAARTTRIESEFQTMVDQLAAAVQLVNQVQEDATSVTDVINNVPQEWAEFVTRVIEVNKAIVKRGYEAYESFRGRLSPTKRDLRILGRRGTDLAQLAETQRSRLEDRIAECNQLVRQTDGCRGLLENLAPQVSTLVQQVVMTHHELRARFEVLGQQIAEADEMERAIDECEDQEREVRARVAQLKPAYERCEQLRGELTQLDQDIAAREESVRVRTLELASLRQIRETRARQLASQLQSMEAHLQRLESHNGEAAALSQTLAVESRLLADQVRAVDQWSSQAGAWRQTLQTQLLQLRQRIQDPGLTPVALTEAHTLLERVATVLEVTPSPQQT